jgi:hypothetical protein
MAFAIDKRALVKFLELLESKPQSYISFERAVEMMSDVGFSCHLACTLEHWEQSVRFLAPPSGLVPIEVEIETPFGIQRAELERRMSLPLHVRETVDQLRHIVETATRLEGQGETVHIAFLERIRAIESELIEGIVGSQNVGTLS